MSTFTHTALALGTVVNFHVAASQQRQQTVETAIQNAMEAMKAVEAVCSRFDEESELVQLLHAPVGTAVRVSPILFQSLQFACEVAKWTDGRFDPTVGSRMEALGFRKHYLTGDIVRWNTADVSSEATFRDIELDPQNQMIRLHHPMRLDLGAVAKGLAVDLAVQAISSYEFPGFVVDAGGDLYAAGSTMEGKAWTIGIRHPMHHDKTIRTLQVQDMAVCTSGTYERRSPKDAKQHHILDTRTGQSAQGFMSVTAVGPYTMMTDAFSTAAFLYTPFEALKMLEEVDLEGLVVTDDLEVHATAGMNAYFHESNA